MRWLARMLLRLMAWTRMRVSPRGPMPRWYRRLGARLYYFIDSDRPTYAADLSDEALTEIMEAVRNA